MSTEIGNCQYCNAMIMVNNEKGEDQEQINKTATMNCDCTGANAEREKRNRILKAKQRLEELCWKDSEELGFTASITDIEVRALLEQLVMLAAEYKINGVAIDLSNSKVIIQVNNKGKINIARSQNIRYKHEA